MTPRPSLFAKYADDYPLALHEIPAVPVLTATCGARSDVARRSSTRHKLCLPDTDDVEIVDGLLETLWLLLEEAQ